MGRNGTNSSHFYK